MYLDVFLEYGKRSFSARVLEDYEAIQTSCEAPWLFSAVG